MTDIGGSKFLTKGQVTLTSESKSWLDSPPTNQFCVQTTILNHVSNSFLRQRKFFFLFWCPRSCLDLGRMVLAFFFVFNKALHHIGHNKNNIWTPVLVYSVGWLVRLVVTFGRLIWSVDWNIWKPKPWEYISYELLTPLSVTVAAGRVWKYSKSRFQQKIKHANNFLAFGKHFELWRTPHFTDKKNGSRIFKDLSRFPK